MTNHLAAGQEQMFSWIAGLTGQLRDSATFPGLDKVKPLTNPPSQILFCGMGGSAQAAGLIADGWPDLAVPVWVHRDSGLPAWAGSRTLVIACSHSGNTAETLAALAEARKRGCPLAAVTSGGEVLAIARGDQGGEAFPAVIMPAGQPPRTVMPAALGALLHLLHRFGLLPDPTESIVEATAQLDTGLLVKLDGSEPVGRDGARSLAADLKQRYTVVYTAGQEAHGAGRRLVAQFNENAKAPGHHAEFPELTHNEIVGWNMSPEQRRTFSLVVLMGQDMTADDSRRVTATLDLLSDQFAGIHRITAQGSQRLTRLLGLILFGDLVSAEIAVLTDVDPVPIARIDALKSCLAQLPPKGSS